MMHNKNPSQACYKFITAMLLVEMYWTKYADVMDGFLFSYKVKTIKCMYCGFNL